MTPKINRLSQDNWHYATLQNIFDQELFAKICSGLSIVKWKEASKSFYLQREEDLRCNQYYQEIFSKDVCNEIIKNMELFFCEKFAHEFDITAHQMIDGDYIGIHTDSNDYGESHRLTLMLNESWSIEQGGILLALNENSLKNIQHAWLPMANTGFVFEIGEHSYHAVTPIKGKMPRYSIIFTFKKQECSEIKKSFWTSFPLISDLKHAISTASYMGIGEATFNSKYIAKRFRSIKDFNLYIDGYLENVPSGFTYKNNNSINVDQNGVQSKGTDKERIDNISQLKRIPPIIIVKRANGTFVLVDGSHRLSYAKDNDIDISVIIYHEIG